MAQPASRIFFDWLPVALWLAVIALESFAVPSTVSGGWLHWLFRHLHIHLSQRRFDELHHFLRKAGHFTGYGILCVLLLRAWYDSFSGKRRMLRAAIAALISTLATAALDEWHQSFDRLRTGAPRDVVLDMFGAAVFLLLAWIIYRVVRRGRQPATA